MAPLTVCLFGCFRISLDKRPITKFVSDKARALLAYLAIEAERPHRRESLAALFWPNRPEDSARANLRQALHRLLETLGDAPRSAPYLFVNRQEVQFNSQSCWLDVEEFVRMLTCCRLHHPAHSPLCEDCLARLHSAVSWYKGDLLAGFSLPNCPEFEWWLLSRQEEFHHRALECLDWLVLHYGRCGDFLKMSQYAQRAIELEPWREFSHRQKMRALALSGQAVSARRQYEFCCQILASELGIAPSLETTRLHEQICRKALKPSISYQEPQSPIHENPDGSFDDNKSL